jgi:plasmid maintenance system antidote protein VapI
MKIPTHYDPSTGIGYSDNTTELSREEEWEILKTIGLPPNQTRSEIIGTVRRILRQRITERGLNERSLAELIDSDEERIRLILRGEDKLTFDFTEDICQALKMTQIRDIIPINWKLPAETYLEIYKKLFKREPEELPEPSGRLQIYIRFSDYCFEK